MRSASTLADVKDEIAVRAEAARNDDEATLAPLHLGWRAVKVLSCVRAAHQMVARCGTLLPPTQRSMYRLLQENSGPACIQEWTRQRLRTLLNGGPAPGEVRLCLALLCFLLETLPLFVPLATLPLIGSEWPTRGRMGKGAMSCGVGCHTSVATTSRTT